jgi:hypothetical protein
VEIRGNEAGGQTVTLAGGDDLRKVPKSHRHLITSNIRTAFADPTQYFRDVADQCRFPQMARWLRALLAENQWALQLHRGYGKHASAGFCWRSENVRCAMIGLPSDLDLSGYPASLQEYYSLVDVVDWDGVWVSRSPRRGRGDPPLTVFRFDYYGAEVDLDETFVWGYSPCGDMLIYTADGRGGWLNHESHQIHLLGTIADAINWVYSELLANRCPEWNQRKWNRRRA